MALLSVLIKKKTYKQERKRTFCEKHCSRCLRVIYFTGKKAQTDALASLSKKKEVITKHANVSIGSSCQSGQKGAATTCVHSNSVSQPGRSSVIIERCILCTPGAGIHDIALKT